MGRPRGEASPRNAQWGPQRAALARRAILGLAVPGLAFRTSRVAFARRAFLELALSGRVFMSTLSRRVLLGLAVSLSLLAAATVPERALACTLWALSGPDAAGGGTFLAKNRDFTPDHPNILAVISPKSGYRMVSLVSIAPDGRRSPVGGVNEKGLAFVGATVGTLSRQERRERIRQEGLLNPARTILSGFSSVAGLEAAPELLARLGPVFALVADAREVAVLESAGGSFRLWKMPPGSPAVHTNHPLSADFPEIRSREDAQGSSVRLERMRHLLEGLPRPVSFADFAALAQDRCCGPDESIFRTGSSLKKPRTLAALAISLPPGGGAATVQVSLSNPGAAVENKTLLLDADFWKNAPPPGAMREL